MTTPDPVEVDASESGLPKDRPHGILRRMLSGFLSYGVVIIALWFLFNKLTESAGLPTAISLITWPQVVVICILGVVNLATNLPPLAICLPGLRLREAAVTNTASAALSNTVPEGGAVATGLNFAMLRSWGFALDDITSEVIVTGVWSQMTKYLLLALALVVVSITGPSPSGTIWFALIVTALWLLAAVLLGLILRSTRFARRLGIWLDALVRGATHVFKKLSIASMEQQVPKFRTQMVSLLRQCWGRLSIAMLVSQLTACFVLGVACRMQGLGLATISWATIILAYSLMTLASLLIPTPGGLGVAEVVLVAVLGYGLPESDQAAVLAAVLLYRLATFLVPIPIGLVTYLYWRKSKRWRRPVDSMRVSFAQH